MCILDINPTDNMKKTIFLFLCLIMMGQGAFSLTVNTTAGGLATAVGAELSTVTNLTITGTIDARDFKTMRDNMTAIAEIDLSTATIVDYSGTLGTSTTTTVYPANEIPTESFYLGKSQKLSLTKITFPSALSSIGYGAFYGCVNLKNVTIPETVTTINARAFQSCNSFTEIVIPNGVTVLNNNILYDCNGLLSLTIGNAVTSIKTWAFGCSNLKTFNCLTSTPPTVEKDWFYGGNVTDVFVPTDAAVTAFRANSAWITAFPGTIIKKVGTIGGPFLSVSATALQVSSAANSSTTFTITSNTSWTIASDQPVCVVSPTSGSNNGTITVTATTENTASTSRTANLTITGVEVTSIVITATQAAATMTTPVSKTVAVTTAGTLNYLLTAEEKSTITDLTVTGNIDAQDIATMYYYMPILAVLDLSGASIVQYSTSYPANQLPLASFCNGGTGVGKTTLRTVILPNGLTSIGGSAFRGCTGITTITLPAGINTIEGAAFYGCTGLTSLTIPTSVTNIGSGAFTACTSLTTLTIPASVTSIGDNAFQCYISVDENNLNYSSIDGLLFNKTQTNLMQCPISKTGNFTIPTSVTSIGRGAFSYRSGLTSITIPSTLISIATGTFFGCTSLISIYSNKITPVDLAATGQVFYNVNFGTCTLYVPIGSKSAYQAAVQWKDFTNIVEVATAVPTLSNYNVKIYSTQSAIIVEGTSVGETVSVYNLFGVQLQTIQSKGERLVLPMKQNGVYLVKTTNKTFKVKL